MCETGYVLTSKRDQCIYCGSGCQTCILNENNAPICTKCDSNTFLGDNHCLTCPSECRYDCEYNATLNENAVLGSAGNTGSVELIYSNNPNNIDNTRIFHSTNLANFTNVFL